MNLHPEGSGLTFQVGGGRLSPINDQLEEDEDCNVDEDNRNDEGIDWNWSRLPGDDSKDWSPMRKSFQEAQDNLAKSLVFF